jgi:hypothetical protein
MENNSIHNRTTIGFLGFHHEVVEEEEEEEEEEDCR